MTEIPDADLAEQETAADPTEVEPAESELPEIDEAALQHANEADVMEQSLPVPENPDDYR